MLYYSLYRARYKQKSKLILPHAEKMQRNAAAETQMQRNAAAAPITRSTAEVDKYCDLYMPN